MSMFGSSLLLYWLGNADVVVRPLLAEDIAAAATYMLDQPRNISIKALDVVPTGMNAVYHKHLC